MVGISSKTTLAILLTLILVLVSCGGSDDGTARPEDTSTPIPTDTVIGSDTPVPTEIPAPEPTHTLDDIGIPIDTPIPTPTPISTPTVTPMPMSSPTPTPTPSPTPIEEITPIPTDTTAPEAEPQCGFNGYVAIDDASVPDDTVISAWIDGKLVGSAATVGSAYEMIVSGDYAGKVVTFKIGSYQANQSSVWENGADIVVGLSVRLGPPVCGFYGIVTLSGGIMPDESTVSALVEGVVVGSTTVIGSWYNLVLAGEYSGKTVHFQVDFDQAMETSIWERGGNKNVNLTVLVSQ